MDRVSEAGANLKALEHIVSIQRNRPHQTITVSYSLEQNLNPHVSYYGLYIKHFESEGLWNIELIDLEEIIHFADASQAFEDLLFASIVNTDESWDVIARNEIKIDLENRRTVRWLGDLVVPIFSLY